jgi:alkyl sulfatase BDS1-like metallo-beta-lactamase superfamily hydrolase
MIIADPARYVEYFRIRIDPTKSDEVSSFVRFDFPNSGSVGLDVRRAVVEFVPDPDEYARTPDIVLRMTGDTWANLYLGRVAPESLIEAGAIEVTGDAFEAARILNLFDRLEP